MKISTLKKLAKWDFPICHNFQLSSLLPAPLFYFLLDSVVLRDVVVSMIQLEIHPAILANILILVYFS